MKNMIRNYFLAGFATMLFFGAAAQTSTLQKAMLATPQVESTKANTTNTVIRYNVSHKPNLLILQISELTEGNEVLTEKVIAIIQQSKPRVIKRVVLENEFNLLSEELKLEAIKKTDVINIINSIK